jgi:hypothetical protein
MCTSCYNFRIEFNWIQQDKNENKNKKLCLANLGNHVQQFIEYAI